MGVDETSTGTSRVSVICRPGLLFRHSTMQYYLRRGCFLLLLWSSAVNAGKIYPPGIFIETEDAKPIFKPGYQPRKLFTQPHSANAAQQISETVHPDTKIWPLFRARHSNSVNGRFYGSDSRKTHRRIDYYSYTTVRPGSAADRNDERHQSIKRSQNSDIWNIRLPKGCYRNANGYLCCNKQLEQLMKEAMQQATVAAEAAEEIQKVAEDTFDRQFEAIVAPSDFAYKINFARNFICKVEMNGQFALAYGIPNSQKLS